MSTSVYKPIGLFQSRIPAKMLFSKSDVRKVKRALFEPANPNDTQKFLEEEMQKITVYESEKWNFDFKTERTLNPNGIYNWRPVTPQKVIRPIKRRQSPSAEDFDGHELYGFPDEIIRPIPVRAVVEEVMKSPPSSQKTQPQRLITDFMSVRKRPSSSSDSLKKNEWVSTMERPVKIPRLSDLSS